MPFRAGQVTPRLILTEETNSQDHRPSSGTQKPASSVSDQAPHALPGSRVGGEPSA